MTLVLYGLGIVSSVELLLWFRPIWRIHKPLAYLLMVAIAAISGTLLALQVSTWTVLLCVFSLFRIINLLRIIEGRIQADYLFHASRRTTIWLISGQLAMYALVVMGGYIHINVLGWWYTLVMIQLSMALILWVSTMRHLRTTSPPPLITSIADRDLPSLTVAIPARNENEDLEACLRTLITSTYPKLEILVLDDCSQDKRTSDIIRAFAHDGVRFIAGTPPPDSWLAKNHAYAQLAAASNGELLLFCGVDARFTPQSLGVMVKTMLQKQKSMASIIPRNIVPSQNRLAALIIQSNRYAWELMLPRKLLQQPPVLSTCWLITREALQATGGFEAVRRKGVPESYFARATAGMSDGYSFLQSDNVMGLSCFKSVVEQRATAIRTRYLQLHRRPELVLLLAFAEFAIFVWPPVMLVVAVLSQVWLLAVLSGLSVIAVSRLYYRILRLTFRQRLTEGWWLAPVAALYDIGLLIFSMWQYEFNVVLWKGRNVCIPVMRIIPRDTFMKDLEQK